MPASPRFGEMTPGAWQPLPGAYELEPGRAIRVFDWNGRPFVVVPGQGEAELFALGEDRFTVRVVAGVGIHFERDADGRAEALVLKLGPRRLRAVRR